MEGEHPEIRHGEIWLINTFKEEYHKISYKTKRMGNVAYAKSGYVIEGCFPLFVQKDEYDEHMDGITTRKHLDDIIRRSH